MGRQTRGLTLQPHKGTSETGLMGPKEVAELALQPHKGTSETRYLASSEVSKLLLQPHKGTSETVPDFGHTDSKMAVLHK